MRFNEDILLAYMSRAPLALAFERALECRIYRQQTFEGPILDLGCGDGLFASVLFAERIDTGIEPNSAELKRAGRTGRYLELIRCTGDAIPKPDGSYRTVFSNSVLEHIPELAPVFHEVHRVLAPGGLFLVTVPSVQFEHYTLPNQFLSGLGLRGLAARYRRFCSRVIWKQSQYFTLEGWRALAERFGFEVVESREYDPKRVCLLNNFLYPLGAIGAINRRLFGRWVLAPSIRRKLIYPLLFLAELLLRGAERADGGGLVFMALRKAARS